MSNKPPGKLDVIALGHTVGLHLEPGSSGPNLVFFSNSTGFLCTDFVAKYCKLITLVPFLFI